MREDDTWANKVLKAVKQQEAWGKAVSPEGWRKQQEGQVGGGLRTDH